MPMPRSQMPEDTQGLKPSRPPGEQLRLLERRGMDIDSPDAERWIAMVGYYRLSGYWYPFRQPNSDPEALERRLSEFIPGTHFSTVQALYEFDRKLRSLVHDGIERIEIALRSQLGYLLGSRDPRAHLFAENFPPKPNRSKTNHIQWLNAFTGRVARAPKSNEVIRHHVDRYRGQIPIWAALDFADFKDVSQLYELLVLDNQVTVAEELGVPLGVECMSSAQRSSLTTTGHPLSRWFEQLSVMRNIAAHHGRLWNRGMVPAQTSFLRAADLTTLPEGQSETVYGALTLMAHLLESTSPGTSWPRKLANLVTDDFPAVDGRSVEEMGFLAGWHDSRPWDRP